MPIFTFKEKNDTFFREIYFLKIHEEYGKVVLR